MQVQIPLSDILIKIFERKNALWKEHFSDRDLDYTAEEDPFLKTAKRIHFQNYYQWIREEKVRLDHQPCEIIIKLKREIDYSNQRRNEFIGIFDQQCISHLSIIERDDFSNLILNSETPGQMVDRLSILSLKIFFMEIYTTSPDHNNIKANAIKNIEILKKQMHYLSTCYDRFVANLTNGLAYTCPYKQIKLYSIEDLKR